MCRYFYKKLFLVCFFPDLLEIFFILYSSSKVQQSQTLKPTFSNGEKYFYTTEMDCSFIVNPYYLSRRRPLLVVIDGVYNPCMLINPLFSQRFSCLFCLDRNVLMCPIVKTETSHQRCKEGMVSMFWTMLTDDIEGNLRNLTKED